MRTGIGGEMLEKFSSLRKVNYFFVAVNVLLAVVGVSVFWSGDAVAYLAVTVIILATLIYSELEFAKRLLADKNYASISGFDKTMNYNYHFLDNVAYAAWSATAGIQNVTGIIAALIFYCFAATGNSEFIPAFMAIVGVIDLLIWGIKTMRTESILKNYIAIYNRSGEKISVDEDDDVVSEKGN